MLSKVVPATLILAFALGPVQSVQSARQQPDAATIAAAIAELNNLHQELLRRQEMLRTGGKVEPDGERRFEDQVRLVQILVESSDPVVIRPLLLHMIGEPVTNAIAAFGELAVVDVIAAVSAPELGTRASALRTLQQMLERPVRYPLSFASKQSIIEVAQRELSGNPPMGIIWRAVELAVATREPDLLNRVRRIAASESEVRALKITGSKDIAWVRDKARAALAARGLEE
jgi:hypothetical protein